MSPASLKCSRAHAPLLLRTAIASAMLGTLLLGVLLAGPSGDVPTRAEAASVPGTLGAPGASYAVGGAGPPEAAAGADARVGALPGRGRSADPPPAPSGVGRHLQAVVLTGADLPALSATPMYVERPPLPGQEEEQGDGWYLPADVLVASGEAAPVERLAAWRYQEGAFLPVPLQVDERFLRYLTNTGSGFATYSQSDAEMGYAFDVEGTRRTCEAAHDALRARLCEPARPAHADPVPGLDDDDELVFMASDAGLRAPEDVPWPAEGLHEVVLRDPLSDARSYLYVGVATGSPDVPAYVRYQRDADADVYVLSGHRGFGGAPGGRCYPGDGVDAPWGMPRDCGHRRPKDSATVETEGYRFHIAGRWKMDSIELRLDDAWGDDLVDRWKGRAFQRQAGEYPVFGDVAENETSWSLSSVLLGERAGPVRAIRETWGAASGTHTTMTETWTRHGYVQRMHLRTHPMPPHGIYGYWDLEPGAFTHYDSPLVEGAVAVDGRPDRKRGPDGVESLQPADWSWHAAHGRGVSIVQVTVPVRQGAAVAESFYRDDASFDDGTGSHGLWGAFGMHVLLAGETDNLFSPVPLTEAVWEIRHHILHDPAIDGAAVQLLERHALEAEARALPAD